MHIDYKQAPWVIQRFGDINMLVNQSLDPLVSAYFKDVAQTKTLIELIQERSSIRERAVMEMKEKFQKYNLSWRKCSSVRPRHLRAMCRLKIS